MTEEGKYKVSQAALRLKRAVDDLARLREDSKYYNITDDDMEIMLDIEDTARDAAESLENIYG